MGIMIVCVISMLSYLGKVSEFTNFIMVVVTFGMTVAIKLFVNQYIEKEQYELINILSTIDIVKLIILMFYLYFEMVHKVMGIEMQRFILEYNVIDGILLICLRMMLEDKRCFNVRLQYVLGIIGISILGCRLLPNTQLAEQRHIVNVLNFCIVCLSCEKWYRKKSKAFGVADSFLGMYLIFYAVQLLFIVLKKGISFKFYPTISILSFAKAVVLFCFAYHICLSEPWFKRIKALNDAELLIKEQEEACSMIVNLSHELKTPVNIIRSALDLLILDYNQDEQVLKRIRAVKMDCNQIMNIIQDMIDIQKIKGHHTQVKYKVYNLVEVVESVVDVFTEEIDTCQIVFNPIEEEIYQKVDLALIQQCFVLLFGMLCTKKNENMFYIEMGKMNNEEQYLVIQHPRVGELYQLSKCIPKENKEHSEIAGILTLQLIEYLLKQHHATMQYEKMNDILQIRMIFPSCNLTSDEWIDEMSLAVLRDQVKGRDIEGLSINWQ